MATRNKTVLFISLRNSLKQSNPYNGNSEIDALISHSTAITLPPAYVDTLDTLQESFNNLLKNINSFETLSKSTQATFDNSATDEINQVSSSIAQDIAHLSTAIKKLKIGDSSEKNIKMGLAAKLSGYSTRFSQLQTRYVNKVKQLEGKSNMLDFGARMEDDELDSVFTEANMQAVETNNQAINQRHAAIEEIVKSITGLSVVFKELQNMVIDQGTVLDRIDYNIEMVDVYVKEAHGELVKGSKYQDTKKAKYCIILLGVVVGILLLVVIFKKK